MSRLDALNAVRAASEAVSRMEDELSAMLQAPPCAPDPRVLMARYVAMFPDWARPERTKVLLFAHLFVYDRGALLGRRMRKGVRRWLAQSLGLNSGVSVSERARDLLFCYSTFPAFRSDCDRLLDNILGIEG